MASCRIELWPNSVHYQVPGGGGLAGLPPGAPGEAHHSSVSASFVSFFHPFTFSVLAFFPSLTGNRSGLDLSK